jgi:hypothetical protein
MVALMVTGCARQEAIELELESLTASVVDAGPAFDPCAWDGGPGYCYGVTGWVSSGDGCSPVCAPGGNTNGKVFKTHEECALTCSCKPEKFATPLMIGSACDEAWMIISAAASVERCTPLPEGQRCLLDISAGPLDTRGLATLCEASASSVVRLVGCNAPTE